MNVQKYISSAGNKKVNIWNIYYVLSKVLFFQTVNFKLLDCFTPQWPLAGLYIGPI